MTRFDRSKRLTTPAQFQRVFKKSRRFADDLLVLRVHYREDSPPRLGLAIARKHARLAVQRNRIKRCARETFRRLHCDLAPGDYVLTNLPNAARASKARLNDSIEQLLRTAIRKKPPIRRADSA